MVNWGKKNTLFKKFTEKLTEEWINAGFNKEETREWLKSGLRPIDSEFARFLKKANKSPRWFLRNEDLINYPKFAHKADLRHKNHQEMYDAQKWLDECYPEKDACSLKEGVLMADNYGKKRNEIAKLNISGNDLKNSLTIKDWPNLEIIYVEEIYIDELSLLNLPKLKVIRSTWSPIRKLKIIGCPIIKNIDVSSNELSDLGWLDNLSSENLKELNLADNRFTRQNLSVFSRFANLEQLFINTNDFFGSLKYLKDLAKLKTLNISHTSISSGLKYLSSALKDFTYDNLDLRAIANDNLDLGAIDKAHDEEDFSTLDCEEWLEEWYPKNGVCKLERYKNRWNREIVNENYGKTRKEIISLDISKQNLRGFLNLSDFENLQRIDCTENRIIELNLGACRKLKEVEAGFNRIMDLFLPADNQIESLWLSTNQLVEFPKNLNNKTLKFLGISENYISSDLSVFSELIKLEKLYIGRNWITGSLSYLAKLENLKELHVSMTKIDSGLEYLPEKLERLYCRKTNLFEILKPYLDEHYDNVEWRIPNNDGYYRLSDWKKDNRGLMSKTIPKVFLDSNFIMSGTSQLKEEKEKIDLLQLESESIEEAKIEYLI